MVVPLLVLKCLFSFTYFKYPRKAYVFYPLISSQKDRGTVFRFAYFKTANKDQELQLITQLG